MRSNRVVQIRHVIVDLIGIMSLNNIILRNLLFSVAKRNNCSKLVGDKLLEFSDLKLLPVMEAMNQGELGICKVLLKYNATIYTISQT